MPVTFHVYRTVDGRPGLPAARPAGEAEIFFVIEVIHRPTQRQTSGRLRGARVEGVRARLRRTLSTGTVQPPPKVVIATVALF